MSRGMGTNPPPRTWDVRGVSNHRFRHGIRLDMVSKQALCILLECFVVGHHFTNNSVREIKIWFHHLGSLQSDEPLKMIFGCPFCSKSQCGPQWLWFITNIITYCTNDDQLTALLHTLIFFQALLGMKLCHCIQATVFQPT